MTGDPRRIGWRDHLVGLALGASYVALLLQASAPLGMSRDESFYVDAANRYGAWFELLADDPSAALDRASVDAHWNANHEHPSLPKSMFALTHLAQQRWEIFATASMSYRFMGMVSAGLLLWLVYIFGARAFGRGVGVFAALALALMPRIFYHSQLDCFDVPIALMMTLVAYLYWRALSDVRWAVAVAIAFGLCLETKHNAWTLPAIFWIHWVFVMLAKEIPGPRTAWQIAFRVVAIVGPLLAFGVTLFAWVLVPVVPLPITNVAWLGFVAFPVYLGALYLLARRAKIEAVHRYIPVAWVAMVLVGPILFIALWPWMWFDTAMRFREYAAFHFGHVHYNMAYFGVNYFRPPLPMSYPWVMTLFTVSLTTIALAIGGLGARARALVPRRLAERWWPGGQNADERHTDVLLVGQLLAPLVVISMPWTPIFGGTKHWFSAYPFLALYAGVGYAYVARAALERLPSLRTQVQRGAVYLASASVLLAAPALETAHSQMFGLSHYTFAAGGTAGAADYGMNRQFWGFTTGSLAPWLNEHLPEGGTVYPCDTTWTAWRMLQEDGLLSARIRPNGDLVSADYAIVHLEHHFVEVDYQIWAAWGSVQPVYVLTHDGVPIVNVYENPRRRAAQGAPTR
ncbi:MAG: ArnT family glycosyltransferase [Sandaracinaceae bacterium]